MYDLHSAKVCINIIQLDRLTEFAPELAVLPAQ